MAQKVTTHWIDDLDGSEATTTVPFEIDGFPYEIDVNDENAQKLRDALAPYVQAGRKMPRARQQPRRGRGSSPSPANGMAREERARIRAWAQGQGLGVGDRGRISGDVQERYYRENPSTLSV